MKMALLSFGALTLMIAVCHAQKVGDSEQTVLKALGTPPMSRAAGERLIWVYPDGTKIVLKGGVVVEVKIGPPNPVAQSQEAALREEARQAVLPKTQTNVYPAVGAAPKRRVLSRYEAGTGPNTPLGIVMGLGGVCLMFICGIRIIAKAFDTSWLWGFGSIFVPFCKIVFVATNWSETKIPFLLYYLVGLPLAVASLFM